MHSTSEPQNFQNDFKFEHRRIHVANINIRHLKPKLDQVKIMLHGSTIDIFGVCEIFLNSTVDDDIISINGFTHERNDRYACVDIKQTTVVESFFIEEIS